MRSPRCRHAVHRHSRSREKRAIRSGAPGAPGADSRPAVRDSFAGATGIGRELHHPPAGARRSSPRTGARGGAAGVSRRAGWGNACPNGASLHRLRLAASFPEGRRMDERSHRRPRRRLQGGSRSRRHGTGHAQSRALRAPDSPSRRPRRSRADTCVPPASLRRSPARSAQPDEAAPSPRPSPMAAFDRQRLDQAPLASPSTSKPCGPSCSWNMRTFDAALARRARPRKRCRSGTRATTDSAP